MTEPTPFELMHPCRIFQWIGQPFSSCADCGRPYWEHLYDPPYAGQKTLFRVKQGIGNAWEWRRVGSLITRKQAESARARWGQP